MPDLDLDRLKDVPRELLERYVRRCVEEDLMDDELRAALKPKLRTRARVDTEIVNTVRDGVYRGSLEDSFWRLRDLCNEPTAPDPDPAPSEREQELQREVEELKRDRVAIDKHSAGLIEELERVRCRNRFLESIISQVAAEAQRPQS